MRREGGQCVTRMRMWLWGGYGFILTSAASARAGLGFGEGGFFWKDLAFEWYAGIVEA